MNVYELSKRFPREERFGMTDQIRRSSRSVCATIAEAWRKRRYPNAFISKLNDAESEAEETRVWLEFAVECRYLDADEASALDAQYNDILGKLVLMLSHPEKWCLKPPTKHKENANANAFSPPLPVSGSPSHS
jgi:four helix bundle protein